MNNLESLKYIFNTFTKDEDVGIIATKDAPRTDLREKIIYIPEKYLDAEIDNINRQILLHLLFHERAHILYTPVSYQKVAGSYSNAMKFILNVLEDIKVDTKTLKEKELKSTNLPKIRYYAAQRIVEENLESFKKNPLFINALLHLYLFYCYSDISFDDQAKSIAYKIVKKFDASINELRFKRYSLEKEVALANDILNFLKVEIPKERRKIPKEIISNTDINKSHLFTEEEKQDLKEIMEMIKTEKESKRLRDRIPGKELQIRAHVGQYRTIIDRLLKNYTEREKLISKEEFEKTFNIKFDEQLINLYRLLEAANYSKDNEIRRKANKLRHKIVNITRLIANGGSSVAISESITNVFRNIYDYRNLKLTKKNKENIEKIKIIPKEVRQKIENGIHLTNELENWFTKDITNLFETETIEAEEKKIYLFVDVSSSMTPEQIKWAILTVKAFKKAIDLDNFELYKFNTRVFKWNKKGKVEEFFEKIGGGTSYSEVERKINKLNDSDEKLFIILTDMHFYPYELERIDKMIGYNQNIIFLLIRKKLALDNIARICVPRLKKYFKKYLSPTFDAYVKNLNEILNIYLRT